MKQVSLQVNGIRRKAQVDDRELLVDLLREKLRLTGTHVGCDTSQCGACTVLLDGQAVKSCAIFALQANGAKVTTIEGLAKGGEMHPIQQAFHEQHGLQCGFCTPGMIMTLHDYLSQNPNPTETQVRTALAGNMCRCTGYQNIVESALAASKQRGI
ncbi:MAG: carbon monoxide dehydrogenase [Chloroflexi bacterium]|nr:carbon monoxide dehydrogenase [Chloroflexota bacterium]|tara:strand:- start:3639 stop:4106 length:468 start_codon:yes stop_codon:yes gene_type:complete